jgi:hypothetical protein
MRVRAEVVEVLLDQGFSRFSTAGVLSQYVKAGVLRKGLS